MTAIRIARKFARRILILFACTVTIFAAVAPAFGEKRLALVIGNDRYPNLPAREQLQKAANDAAAVGDALEKLGFHVIRGINLGRQEMVAKLTSLTSQLEPGDVAAVFYAGHGVALGGVNYLLPSDLPPVTENTEASVRGNSISEPYIVSEIQSRGARVTLLVIDACRDNPFPRAGTRTIGNSRGLSEAKPARGVFTIYSAGIGQSALDRLENADPSPNSVFTRVFVEQLARTDQHLGELVVEVREKVAELALKAKNEFDKPDPHEQTPAYYDQTVGGRVYLAGRPIAVETKPGAVNADVARLQERLRGLEEQLQKREDPKAAFAAPVAPPAGAETKQPVAPPASAQPQMAALDPQTPTGFRNIDAFRGKTIQIEVLTEQNRRAPTTGIDRHRRTISVFVKSPAEIPTRVSVVNVKSGVSRSTLHVGALDPTDARNMRWTIRDQNLTGVFHGRGMVWRPVIELRGSICKATVGFEPPAGYKYFPMKRMTDQEPLIVTSVTSKSITCKVVDGDKVSSR